jgi:signal transduction histidine kinase
LDKENGAALLFQLRPGSEVSVTGICEVLFRENQRGSDFPRATGVELLMRSPEDVRVLRAASWWTKTRLLGVLGATLGVLALALAWAWLLKRKVNERTLQLAGEIQAKHNVRLEFEATLRERNRLAGDLHDTVEQAFTAVSFQFQTARALRELNPEKAENHLLLAEEMLSLSRDELRRSVWDLRNEVLEGRSLKEALLHHTARIVSDHSITCEVFADDETPIPDLVAGHLMLFAQEALNNVLKHAKASKVVFHLTHNDDGVRLSIEDNGHGFDPTSVPGAASGHFGLTGLRERIRRLGGTFSLESSIGHGTRLVAEIPASALAS